MGPVPSVTFKRLEFYYGCGGEPSVSFVSDVGMGCLSDGHFVERLTKCRLWSGKSISVRNQCTCGAS